VIANVCATLHTTIEWVCVILLAHFIIIRNIKTWMEAPDNVIASVCVCADGEGEKCSSSLMVL
jgi:hypothetical protein